MGEETSPLVHWLQITGRYEVVIQAGYVAPSIGSVFFRTHAQFPPNETVNYFADRSSEFRVREMLLVQEDSRILRRVWMDQSRARGEKLVQVLSSSPTFISSLLYFSRPVTF